MPRHEGPPIILLMGVSGCGKTAIGRGLAARLGVPFLDADDLHSPASVASMRAGTPLTDADRQPWLEAVALRLAEAGADGRGVSVACSALKRTYRDLLRAAAPGLRLVYLHGERDTIRRRLERRSGHFMPAALLASQLATLEPPTADEQPIVVDVSPPPEQIVATILTRLAHT